MSFNDRIDLSLLSNVISVVIEGLASCYRRGKTRQCQPYAQTIGQEPISMTGSRNREVNTGELQWATQRDAKIKLFKVVWIMRITNVMFIVRNA